MPAPRRVIRAVGEGSVVPEVEEGGARPQLYGNEDLAPPSAPPLTWVQLQLLCPPQQPQAPARIPSLSWGREELSWLQSWFTPLESQGEGLRSGRPRPSPHRGDVGWNWKRADSL